MGTARTEKATRCTAASAMARQATTSTARVCAHGGRAQFQATAECKQEGQPVACFMRSTTSASHSKSKLSSSPSAHLRGQRLQQPRVLAGCLGRHPEPLQRVVAGRSDTRVWGMGQLACWTGRLALLARLAAAQQVPPAAGCRCSAGGKGWRCTAAHGSGRPPSSRINARMLLSPPPTPLPNQVSQKSVLARACCLW